MFAAIGGRRSVSWFVACLAAGLAGCGESGAPTLADARGLARLSDWKALPQLGPVGRFEQQSSRDRGARDATLPLSDYGNRDFNNYVCASANASIEPQQASPLHFDEPRCAETYVTGAVLARFHGEGRLVRVWLGMSSILHELADAERLRIYVDDDPTPRIDQPLSAALAGSAGPIFAPPFGAGSPRRLAWYYAIGFRSKLIVALDGIGYDAVFHHADVVRDRVELVARDSATEAEWTRRASQQLTAAEGPAGALEPLAAEPALLLPPGERREVALSGPATIHAFELRFPERDYARLGDVRVEVRWDAAVLPVIATTLRELLGAGARAPEASSLALRAAREGETRLLALQLPMPFQVSAQFRFENTGAEPVALDLRWLGERALPPGPLGQLAVQVRETRGPSDAVEHVAVQATGRGRLAGVCAYLQGRPDETAEFQADPLNLLEGDVRATIDGALALDGTGSEEYADDIFYFQDAPQANAFVQAWGIVNEPARTPIGEASFCRWHVLGTELDFASAIELRFERGGEINRRIADLHRTVAYLYLPPPSAPASSGGSSGSAAPP
jgi:hypothetical protein